MKSKNASLTIMKNYLSLFTCVIILHEIQGQSFDLDLQKIIDQLNSEHISEKITRTESSDKPNDKNIKLNKRYYFINKLLNLEGFENYLKSTDKNEISDVTSRNGYLGVPCVTSHDCHGMLGHICSANTCQCDPQHVQVNDTHCLPGVLLGFGCESHSQCQFKVPDSSCIQGFCRCGSGKVPYRRANCLLASKLDSTCRTHLQCQVGTPESICKWMVKNVLGKCQCKPGMPRRGKKCGPLGFALGAPCGKSLDCSLHVPGSVCVARSDAIGLSERSIHDDDGQDGKGSRKSSISNLWLDNKIQKEFINSTLGGVCRCPRGYIVIDNGTRCVPVQKEAGVSPVSLGKPCLFSSQCKASDPFSYCSEGICVCQVDTPECSPKNTGCFSNTFQCTSDGRCISSDFVCNGKRECPDGSDELDCVPGRCSSHAFTCRDGSCVASGEVCDGIPHCPDGSDENKCSGIGRCPQSTFKCKDGQCLPGYAFCNAHVSCSDGSDEDDRACIGGVLRVPHCPFRCKNLKCRATSILCSGKDGCGDNSDEEHCSICSCPKP